VTAGLSAAAGEAFQELSGHRELECFSDVPASNAVSCATDGGTVLLVLSCAWLALVILLLARAFNQRDLLRPLPRGVPRVAPMVTVIVPARNEEINIGHCLRGLLKQNYPATRFKLLLVDDHSIDNTASIALSWARDDRQVSVLRSPPLPSRWLGKSHACWIGAQAASDETEWLCFVDADVRPEPELLTRAVATAASQRLDLLSLAPRQEFGSFAERLLMPCGFYLLAFYQDLRASQSRDAADTTATGQFMLIRRSVYEAVGGHAAVHEVICEDLALARLIKQHRGHVALCDGKEVISVRMYSGWLTLWEGVTKNLVDMLGGPFQTVTTAATGMVLAWAVWLLPGADAASCAADAPGGCFALAPALVASCAAIGFHMAGACYFRIPVWYGLLFPVGYTAGARLAIDSLRRRLRGCVSWKGRTCP
jgi:chlorobactene glucosyltransferase